MVQVFDGTIDKSENDRDRVYRHIKLENELEIMLVSEPEGDKAAACVDVRVGSMQNTDILGLAHFLEHLLFMGTDTFPDEEDYTAYLNKNGGSANAYTSDEDTVYFFDVNADHLEGVLERFSAFFICPLFTESAVDREMNAVDSENSKNLQQDEWRGMMLLSSLAKQDHPFSKFGTGNLATLSGEGIDARSACMEFHKKFYSANIMKACIQGKESLDDLEKLAIKYFSNVENKGLNGPPLVDPSPYTTGETKRMISWVPVKDKKVVSIFFPIPSTQTEYKKKPAEFLAHLLGHESKGSVLEALKQEGLANGLGAYEYRSTTCFAIFSVSIDLTDEGVARADEVVAAVFAYIGMLNKVGLDKPEQDWIGQELKEVYDMTFRFRSKSNPFYYVAEVANNMHSRPVEHVLSGSCRVFDTDSSQAVALLKYLTPDNAIVLLRDKSIAGSTDRKCPWYGTDYSEGPFSGEQLSLWKEACGGRSAFWEAKLHLPNRNELVATDFTLIFDAGDDFSLRESMENENKAPTFEVVAVGAKSTFESIYVDSRGQVDEASGAAAGTTSTEAETGVPTMPMSPHVAWHCPDWTFQQPKVNIRACLASAVLFQDPTSQVLAHLLTKCLDELLTDFSYYAECASLVYSVSLAEEGMVFKFGGFNHKMPTLMKKVFETMKGMAQGGEGPGSVTAAIFDRMKDVTLREYANESLDMPARQAMTAAMTLLKVPRWTNLDKHAALVPVTLADLNYFAQRVLSAGMKVELLSHGNVSKSDATTFLNIIIDTLQVKPLPAAQLAYRRTVRLSPGIDYYHRSHCLLTNPDEVNSAISSIYFVNPDDYTPQILKPSFLSSLDTSAREDLEKFPISLEIQAMCKFLCHVMGDAAFHQLRTIEQLGYIVFVQECDRMMLGEGINIIVQSDKKDAHHLDERVENFFKVFEEKHFEAQLKDEEHFKANQMAIIELLTEKSKNLSEETGRMWDEVSRNRYTFDYSDKLARFIRYITLEHLRTFYDNYISKSADRRCKLAVQHFSKGTKFPMTVPKSNSATQTVIIEDVASFKNAMPLKSSERKLVPVNT